MQIIVWGSDNGGQSWNSSSIATATASSASYTLDKPVMDVSWYSGPGSTLGYIYVAWVESQATPGVTRIVMNRNTGGLAQRCHPFGGGGCATTWDASPTVIADYSLGENPEDPQVVVNPDNGDVYVFWLNFYGQIRFRRFTNSTQTWSAAPITAVQNIALIYNNGNLPNGLRAIVVPTIKYNTATHRVMAVWHAPSPTAATADDTALYYASFDASSINGPVGANLINDAAYSQIQPAIDNDDSGNMLVTYFSTQNNNAYYQQFGLCLDPYGNVSCAPSPVDNYQSTNTFVGDYHETFFWNFNDGSGSRWHTSWARGFSAVVSGVK